MNHAAWIVLAVATGAAAAQKNVPQDCPVARKDSALIASVQCWQPLPGDTRDAVDIMAPFIERAAAEGVDLIVFPEYHLSFFELEGPLVRKLSGLVANHKVNLVVGGFQILEGFVQGENPPMPGTYANASLVLRRDGTLAGNYWKVHPAVGPDSPYCWPPDGTELEWNMVCGDTFPVIELDFGKIGMLTCYDGYFLPVFDLLSLRGAEVLVWVNGRGMVEDHIVRTASQLTCTAVVTSNHSRGTGAFVCDFPGNILARGDEAQENYISARVDLRQLREHRRNFRMFHQRRPDLYKELGQKHTPWEAYPDIPSYSYDQATP